MVFSLSRTEDAEDAGGLAQSTQRAQSETTSYFTLHTSYFVSRTEHAEGAERNHFLLQASHFLFHTCLPMRVTIGAVWANRVLPIDAG
jgi:hypothetical protein